jgi:sortase A
MRWITRALFLIGFVALSYSVGSVIDAELYQRQLRHAFEQQRQSPHKTIRSNDKTFIENMEIPKIGLSVMIADGIDQTTLRRAVGHVPGTAFPGQTGNAALAAHRDTFFRNLGSVAAGDDIIVNTRRGTFHYVVKSTEIVRPKAVRVLRPTPSPELTLITCYPFYYIGPSPKRFVVHAALSDAPGQVANK